MIECVHTIFTGLWKWDFLLTNNVIISIYDDDGRIYINHDYLRNTHVEVLNDCINQLETFPLEEVARL